MKIHSICLISALSLVGASVQAAAPEGWDKSWSDCSKKYDDEEQKCGDGIKKLFGAKSDSKIAVKQLGTCMDNAQETFNKCMHVGIDSVKSKDGKPLSEAEKKNSLALLAKVGAALNKCEATTMACWDKAKDEKSHDECFKALDKCTDEAQKTK